MNNYKKIISVAIAGVMLTGFSSCRDDWSAMNNPEDKLTSATPIQLLTTAEYGIYPFGYGIWFNGAPAFMSLTQMSGFSGGYNETRAALQTPGSQSCMIKLLSYNAAMEAELEKLGADAAQYEAYHQAVKCLAIYCAIQDSDTSGDVPYTEGGRGLYNNDLLKPNYDVLADLYDLWNSELKNAVSVFKNPPECPMASSADDIAYGADWSKWAKFASSLRVKLATRLIHRDLAKAKTIVGEAVADGVMTELDDDLFYHKAEKRLTDMAAGIDAGELAYGSGNNTINHNGQVLSAKVGDFMLKNRDPRLRFMFSKNNWNANIFNFWVEHGHADIIPSFIKERAQVDADGKFVKWKEEYGGNLWARYIGVPDAYEPTSDDYETTATDEFFRYNNPPEEGGHRIEFEGAFYSYRPYSYMLEQHLMTNADYSIVRVPGVTLSEADYQEDKPRYDLYMSSAEVNFYLAEFATYGGVQGLGNPNDYFQKAVTLSVQRWDNLASLSSIPYYHTTYGISSDDETIELKSGEIQNLLNQPDYQLTGNKADDLEKIFLNMEIHFMYSPVDHYITGRRSGIPKFGSHLIARTDFTAQAGTTIENLGRRPNFGIPSLTDPMKEIMDQVYSRQGFTLGISDPRTTLLNTERLWQDVGAPQWGEGPNVGI